MHLKEEKLQNILLQSGIIDANSFQSAKEEASRSGREITAVLLGRNDITEDYLAELLEPYFGSPVVNLETVKIPRETLEMISETYAKLKNVVIFNYDAEKQIVKAAMLDPLDYDTIEFLRVKLNAWVLPHLTTQAGLKSVLKQYKRKIGEDFNKVIAENVRKSLSLTGETNIMKLAEAVPIVTILDSVIEHAVILNASDIHFEPLEEGVLVRYRIDGVLQEILNLHPAIAPILVARVKVLANLQIDEHRLPQDGRFRFELPESGNIDVRVNVMPVMHGEKVEMRLLRSSVRPLTLEELGLSSGAIKITLEETKKPHGMVLVTGPTGSGKTTTLYAILHILNTPKVNITTIEDPIEYEIARVNQTQVNSKAGITFANGLRSLMRQNPDIIMVGEIRDNETVEIAVHAALTGHLVLSSLHTNDAPSALPRLLDMGAPAFLLASTVNIIIAQRLVRKICLNCVESYKTPVEISRLIRGLGRVNAEFQTKIIPSLMYRGRGCNLCGQSGFRGQIGIFEVLRISDEIKNLILKQSPAGEIRKQALKEGMETMFEDGLQKVERGITTIEEILRVVRE